MTGVCVAKNVEEECPTERESVFLPNVHHLTTRHAWAMHTKKRNAMRNVVQVSFLIFL